VQDNQLKELLVTYLQSIAEKAREDAKTGKSDIGSIYDDKVILKSLDEKKIKEAISDIEKATMTKESTARFINAILLAARIIAATVIR